MNLIELLFGQIPEIIFLSLYMIIGKNLKTKRIWLIILMTIEYLFLKYAINLKYTVIFPILYTFTTFAILKALYKDKAQITDIFLFVFGLLALGLCSVPILFLNVYIQNIILCSIIAKILAFLLLFIFRNKLYKTYKYICSFWNRNDAIKRKIKSLTLRNTCVVIFNMTFVAMHIILLYLKTKGGV